MIFSGKVQIAVRKSARNCVFCKILPHMLNILGVFGGNSIHLDKSDVRVCLLVQKMLKATALCLAREKYAEISRTFRTASQKPKKLLHALLRRKSTNRCPSAHALLVRKSPTLHLCETPQTNTAR